MSQRNRLVSDGISVQPHVALAILPIAPCAWPERHAATRVVKRSGETGIQRTNLGALRTVGVKPRLGKPHRLRRDIRLVKT